MSGHDDDFWADIPETDAEETPLDMMQQQAAKLGGKTRNLVEARVYTSTGPGVSEFTHRFFLLVPTLSYYRYELFSVIQTPLIDPLRIFDSMHGQKYEVSSLGEFNVKLKEILSSEKVGQIVANLRSYARSVVSVEAEIPVESL